MINISIITVCKNADNLLKRTILSVLAQKKGSYEYMIQDGGSHDNTLNVAKTYESKFKKRSIRYQIYSETDNGIYDGMNKAIDKCDGDWIIFLNAGDTFYDSRVLEYFEKIGMRYENDVVYGSTNYIFFHNKRLVVTRRHRDIFKGMGICQQSVFYKKELLERRRFDTKYRLLADYEYLLYLDNQKCKFTYMNMIVSNYDYNGISSISCREVYKERAKIMKYYGIPYKKRRPYFYLMLKEKCLIKIPLLNTLQVVHAELNKRE